MECNNFYFIFKNKFQYIERLFVNVTSINKYNPEEIRNLTFYRSNSECGMWRLCVSSKESFMLIKGKNYTMSSFIILELQFYLNSILDQLPEVEPTEEYCKNMYQNIDITIDNVKRNINMNKKININEYTIYKESIEHIEQYIYDSKYINYHPYINFPHTNIIYNNLNPEEKRKC